MKIPYGLLLSFFYVQGSIRADRFVEKGEMTMRDLCDLLVREMCDWIGSDLSILKLCLLCKVYVLSANSWYVQLNHVIIANGG